MTGADWSHGRRAAYALVVIGTIAAALRFPALGAQSLWIDEIRGVALAESQSVAALFQGVIDANPPLYFLLLRAWRWLGSSDALVRAPAAILGLVSVGGVFLLVRRLVDTRVALIAALLVAISPMHVWHSQDSRPYTLVLCLTLASQWAFLELLERPRLPALAGYVAATALGAYTHYTALYVVIFQNAFFLFLLARRRSRMRPIIPRWVAVQAAVALLFAPWLVFVVGRDALTLAFDRPLSPLALPYSVFVFSAGYTLGPSVQELHVRQDAATLLPHLPAIAAVAVLFGLCLWRGVVDLFRRHVETAVFLLGYVVVPLGLAFANVLVFQSLFNVRYAFVGWPAYVAIVAAGLAGLRPVWLRTVSATGVLLLTAWSISNHFGAPAYAKADARSAAAFLQSNGTGADAVIMTPSEMPMIMARYGTIGDSYTFSALDGPLAGLRDRGAAAVSLRSVLDGHRRVWLVLSRTWEADPEGALVRYFLERHRRLASQEFPGVRVWLFDANTSAEELTPWSESPLQAPRRPW